MAIIRDQITIGDLRVLVLDGEPNAGLGLTAHVGSLAIVENKPGIWQKVGAASTAWTLSSIDVDVLNSDLQVIKDRISQLEITAVSAEYVDSLVEEERRARIDADEKLAEDLSSESQLREYADQAEQAARIAADQQLEASIEAEAVARQAADTAEAVARQAADTALQNSLNIEISARQAGDAALDVRVDALEDNSKVLNYTVYENNAQVFADGRPGVEDPSALLRDGWYYTNTASGQKINWYFFDGINNSIVQLDKFNAYAIVTFDSLASMPIMAVYTKPTGINDVMPGFAHSRVVYSMPSTGLVVGKKYLIYFGQEPTVYPAIPRVQMVKSAQSTAGQQLPTEEVLTASFGSNSGAAVNSVKFMTESLGVFTPNYKHEIKLSIRRAAKTELESEISARQAEDASFLKLDGSRKMQGPLDLDGYRIKNVATGVDATDAVNKAQLDGSLEGYASKTYVDQQDAATLQSANHYTDQKVSDLVGAAPELLDTLKELAEAINEDPNFATSVASQIAEIRTDLAEETSARIAADHLIEGSVDALSAELQAEVAARIEADSQERQRALAAEEFLQDQIDAQSTYIETTKQELMDSIAAESHARAEEDLSLQSQINSEVSARIAADEAERQARIAKDQELEASIAAETSARIAADQAEQAARISADSALQSSVSSVQTGLANEVTARTQGDAQLQAKLDEEGSQRNYADLVLQDSIQSEVDRATAAEKQLDEKIDDEIEERQAEGAMLAGEIDSVKASLKTEVSDRQAGDTATLAGAKSYTDQKVSDLVNSAPAILDTLRELADALGNDANFATTITGRIGEVDDKVDQEILDRAAADQFLDDKIEAETLRAEAAEAQKVSKSGDTMSGDLSLDGNDLLDVGRLGIGTSDPESVVDIIDNNVRFSIKGSSTSTSGAVTAVVGSIQTSSNSVELVKVFITGIDGATNESVAYERTVRIKNVGGTVSLGTIQSDYTSEDSETLLTATCTFIVNANSVDVRVTGVNAKNIVWKCLVHRIR